MIATSELVPNLLLQDILCNQRHILKEVSDYGLCS